jgi:hypothetical protein
MASSSVLERVFVDSANPLGTYLRDHLGGAMLGSELAKRAAKENEGTEYGPFLAQLAQDIEADRAKLQEIMERFDVGEDKIKTSMAWAAEKLSRLKANGGLTGYTPLARVLELEGLRSGVVGKLCLWEALLQIDAEDERLDAAELRTLAGRADEQLQALREHHNKAAREAFAGA